MQVLQPVVQLMLKAYRCHCPLAAAPQPLPGTSQRLLFNLRNRNQSFAVENAGFSRYFGNDHPNSLAYFEASQYTLEV